MGDPPQVSDLALAVVLLIVIFLQAIFTAFQDWSSSRIMKSINKMLPQEAHVIRDGKQMLVAGQALVKVCAFTFLVQFSEPHFSCLFFHFFSSQGDVVTLTPGNKIPADVRLVEVNSIKIDKSSVTGESMPVSGSVDSTDARAFDSCNIALMGTV